MVADPIGPGFVANLARPGGNLTGFSNAEPGMVTKWLQLLSDIAPSTSRAAIMFNPDTAPGGGTYYLAAFEATARASKSEPIISAVRGDAEIDSAMTSLGREPGGGLVIMTDAFLIVRRSIIMSAAARNGLPAVYPWSVCPREGGLISYGPDIGDMWRRAAFYVDRILRGAKPAELPVQLPTKFELVINLKTAKALGLAVPAILQATADEVIE
jgi:putative ABC transport system substrate-binding protein